MVQSVAYRGLDGSFSQGAELAGQARWDATRLTRFRSEQKLTGMSYPTTEAELEDALSRPSPSLIDDISALDGDIAVLGAGGKMGPSLCRLARRALDATGNPPARVFAVSRWSDREVEKQLRECGVETVTADLTAPDLGGLPDAGNVIYMVGAKFGTADRPYEAWMTNALVPARVAQRYAGARIAAFSTGNVYPLVPVGRGGSTEDDPVDPVGEYAMSCLGRERVLEAISRTAGTRVAIIRLNYAVEPRYGVLADIAGRIQRREPIDLTTGHANAVWQRYANEVALRSLPHAASPPFVINVTGPETASVRQLAVRLGRLLGVEPQLTGTEAATALLSNAGRCHALFGYPDVPLPALLEWQAAWLRSGGVLWDKPTKFDRRDGRF